MKRLAPLALVLLAGCSSPSPPPPVVDGCPSVAACRTLLDDLIRSAAPDQLRSLRGAAEKKSLKIPSKKKRTARARARTKSRGRVPAPLVGGVFSPTPDPELEVLERTSPRPRARVPARRKFAPPKPSPSAPRPPTPAPAPDLIDQLLGCLPDLSCLP